MTDAWKSPFYDKQSELGAEWEEDSGWLWANSFAGDEGGIKAYEAVREGAGVWDVSPLIKYKFEGPDASKAADFIQTNNIVTLKDGGVRYGAMLDDNGMMLDEGTLYKVNDGRVWIMMNSEGEEFEDHIAKNTAQFDVEVTNEARNMPNLAIQGPRALEVTSKLADVDISGLRYFNFITEPVTFAGAQVMLARTGYSGEKGYEVFLMNPEDGPKVYDAVRNEGCVPQGLDAVLIYRTESGLYVIGVDYEAGETNPYDISFDPHIKFDHDFVGRAAAEDLSRNIKRRYVTLTVEGDAESEYGATVTKAGAEVGVAPSPTVSPKFGAITMASIDEELATEGTEVEVDGRAAKVAPFPIYDTKKERPRS